MIVGCPRPKDSAENKCLWLCWKKICKHGCEIDVLLFPLFENVFVLSQKITWWLTVVLLHSFLATSAAAGARESGGGETEGGGAEEEVWGEGGTDPRSAREPERAANPAAAAGECLYEI